MVILRFLVSFVKVAVVFSFFGYFLLSFLKRTESLSIDFYFIRDNNFASKQKHLEHIIKIKRIYSPISGAIKRYL